MICLDRPLHMWTCPLDTSTLSQPLNLAEHSAHVLVMCDFYTGYVWAAKSGTVTLEQQANWYTFWKRKLEQVYIWQKQSKVTKVAKWTV